MKGEPPVQATTEQLAEAIAAIPKTSPFYCSGSGVSIPMLVTCAGELEERHGRPGVLVYGAPALILMLAGDIDKQLVDGELPADVPVEGTLSVRPSWVACWRPEWIRQGHVGQYLGIHLVKRHDMPARNVAVIAPFDYRGLGDRDDPGVFVYLDTSVAP